MQNYSFFLDLKILIETVRVVFTKEYAEGVDGGPADGGADTAANSGEDAGACQPAHADARRKEHV